MASVERTGHRLIQLGALLFLIGLVTGFLGPLSANPRMILSSHLEGIMNGMVLMILGLLWPRLRLGPRLRAGTFGLALYGTFANWAATLIAALWGAGGRMMPIAAPAHEGTAGQEGFISFLLISLSFAMIAVFLIVLWGLRGAGLQDQPHG